MQKCIFIGNLTKKPEIAEFNGVKRAKFSIAVNSRAKDKVEYFDIVCWRGLAETVEKYLDKGQKVCVVGWFSSNMGESNGVKIKYWSVNADEIEFLSSKREGGEQQPRQRASVSQMSVLEEKTDDLPF